MAISMQIPESLYKYRTFSNYLLQDLCGSESHFASPGIFNDPLDSKPSIGNDITLSRKEQLLKALCKEHRPHKSFEKVLRSEEHTSELQSLMRISYAVFCLKNKK